MSGKSSRSAEPILQRLGQLRFKNLFLITAALLLIDLAIPDFIPLIDEILLGILTMLFWSWRKREPAEKLIEPEDTNVG